MRRDRTVCPRPREFPRGDAHIHQDRRGTRRTDQRRCAVRSPLPRTDARPPGGVGRPRRRRHRRARHPDCAVTNGGELDGKATPDGIAILGNTDETARIVAVSGIDVVLFVGGGVGSAQAMRRAAWALESTGASIMLVPSLTDVSSDRIRVRPAAGLPFVELEGPRAHVATRVLKRSFDVVGSSLLIVLTSPFLAGGAFAVWRHDRGPVLFRQGRVGRDGEVFQCLKLRSMVVDADALVVTMSTENKHSDDHVLFKVERDPRITPPGRFIRRFSIDELPQLFNVFRGEMSLVGPRPPLPREVARYDEDARRRPRCDPE